MSPSEGHEISLLLSGEPLAESAHPVCLSLTAGTHPSLLVEVLKLSQGRAVSQCLNGQKVEKVTQT